MRRHTLHLTVRPLRRGQAHFGVALGSAMGVEWGIVIMLLEELDRCPQKFRVIFMKTEGEIS